MGADEVYTDFCLAFLILQALKHFKVLRECQEGIEQLQTLFLGGVLFYCLMSWPG